MNESNHFMKTRPVFGLLMSMSVPMMISMLIQSLYNIVDSIYLSRLGTQALTAVSLAFPLQNISSSAAIGMGVGITCAVSIHLGAGRQEQANQTATLGLVLAVIHCGFFVLFGLLVTKPFLRLFTHDEQTLAWACQYTYIVVCVSFGCHLQLAMEKIFQAVGSMKVTMMLLAAGCIINIILDPILIFGLLGFPAMGVMGAGIATVTGQIVAFLLYIAVYLHRKKTFPVKLHPRYLHRNAALIKQIYSVGIPSTIMLVMPSVLISVLNGLLSKISDVYVAVLGVYFKLQTFLYMPAGGIVQGMRPIIGHNYGASNTHRVKETIHYSMISAAVIMAVGTAAALIFPEQIFAMFDADEALMTAGVTALRIISLGFVISTVGVIYSGTFEALGRGRDSLIISLLRQFIITIPLSLLLGSIWGVNGVWISFPISELCASIAAYLLFKKVMT